MAMYSVKVECVITSPRKQGGIEEIQVAVLEFTRAIDPVNAPAASVKILGSLAACVCCIEKSLPSALVKAAEC